MNDERPLHVRVTEKLGLVECQAWKLWGTGLSGPEYTNGGCQHRGKCVPIGNPFNRYDISWAHTGPIIERLGIALVKWDADGPNAWNAGHDYSNMCGATPLIAVCNLILSLPDEVVRDSSQVA
jgi:hypothetical protein